MAQTSGIQQAGVHDVLNQTFTPNEMSYTHTNEHVRTLLILSYMSKFGGLRKHEKTQHALYWQMDKMNLFYCQFNSRVVSIV